MTVQTEHDSIVGGDPDTWLSTNFRLREFMDDQGRVYIHRELASVLQILRELFGAPIDSMVCLAARYDMGVQQGGSSG